MIVSNTIGEGTGGDVAIAATDYLEMDGNNRAIVAFNIPQSPVQIGIGQPIIMSTTMSAASGGNVTINTRELNIKNSGQIATGNFGLGRGGELIVNASERVELIGRSFPTPYAIVLSTRTETSAAAGNLIINTRQLIVGDGAQVQAVTWGSGKGGNITVNASELVELIGSSQGNTGLFVSSQDRSAEGVIVTGDAGNIRVNTERLIVGDGARITAASQGSGDAGNVEITARSIELSNQAIIRATTKGGNQGNIILQIQSLQMRGNSSITTDASQSATGGNITINTGVLAALENSDITANAFSGRGGRINITTQALLGLQFRSREQLQTLIGTTDLSQFDPATLSSSDLTAISQTSPQLSGEVAIQLQGIDPSKGLVELPTELVDVAQLIKQNLCTAAQGSEFTIIGRGGLPTPPNEVLNGDVVWEDWRIREANQSGEINSETRSIRAQTNSNIPTTIVEAQGWYKDANGNIILTAETTETPQSNWLTTPNCQP